MSTCKNIDGQAFFIHLNPFKMTIEKLVFLLLALTIFLGSCSDDENMDLPTVCIDDTCIDGEWEWVESTGSIAGITITPITEGQTRKIIIDETNYQEFVDGVLVLEAAYEFVVADDLDGLSDGSLVLQIEAGSWLLVSMEDDNLNLDELCADCWTNKYVKVE